MPYFSTDTVAVQRALETHCDEVLMGKNGVDGVYTADPRLDPAATKYEHLTYTDALVGDLGVMDTTALSLCRDNDVRMRVFGMSEPGNVTRALLGEKIGTLLTTS
jgi:uridylate kinase